MGYTGLSQMRQKARANTQGHSLMDGQTQKVKLGDERQEGKEGEGRGGKGKGAPDFDFVWELVFLEWSYQLLLF